MTTTVAPKTPTPAAAPGAPTPTNVLQTHRRWVIASAVVVVLLLAGYLIVLSNQRKEAFARRALDAARTTAESGQLAQAAGELQRVIQTYGGTDAAKEAVLSLNQIRLINNQNELAAVNLRDFLKSKPAAAYAVPAEALLGMALENANKPAEAAAAYQTAANEASMPFLKADYLIQAGRAFTAAGDTAAAVKAYQTVSDQYQDAPSITEARVRLAELTDGKQPAIKH